MEEKRERWTMSYVNQAVCCGPCGKKAGDGTMPSYMFLSDGRAVCYECGDEAIRRAFPEVAAPPTTKETT